MINPFSSFGFNSVQNDIKNEISSYLQSHEPPIEHQIIRYLISAGDIDINKIRVLKSIDQGQDKILIIVPNCNITNSIIDNINQIMSKFTYRFIEKNAINSTKEIHFYYSK
jgi:hypothetical protein